MSQTVSNAGSSSPIESRSIDWVPENERHGKVRDQGPFWFLGNFQPFTLGIGILGPTLLGLSVAETALACILGVLFGTLFMAFHASQGPTFGLPQMIQSRAQLGYRGVSFALIATLFTFGGFLVVDTVLIKVGLNGIFGWSTLAIAIVITVLSAAIAIFGHDWLHLVFKILFWISLPLWIILTIGVLTGRAGGVEPQPTEFTWAGWLGMFTVAASYNITYAPYVSDYSRYLPKDTKVSAIVGSVFIGAAGAPIWLMPLGAWIGAHLINDPLQGIYQAGNNTVNGLGGLLLVVSVLALVATMGLGAYSGMLTVVTAMDSVKSIKPTRQLRIIVITLLSVIAFAISLALNEVSQTLNNTLLIMLYLLAPWTAINLVDYFFVRRGHYAITDLFTPNGIYGAWSTRGLVAYVVGIAVEIPFMYLPADADGNGGYLSIFAEKFQYVDVSWIVGMVVAGALYFVLAQSIDKTAEAAAIARSEEELKAITGLSA